MGKKKVQMSIEDYQKSEWNTDGITYNAITKRIREGKSLPNVQNYTPFGRFYILNVMTEKK